MNIRLERNWLLGDTTTGTLFIDGNFEAFTLEDKVRNQKVYGETAIPYGTYEVDITHSPKFGKLLPLIKNVPNFQGIRIHPGTDIDDTSGCILPGERIEGDKLINSTSAYNRIFNKISAAKQRGEKITIDVVAPDIKRGINAGTTIGLIALAFSVYTYYKRKSKRKIKK